MEKKLVISFDIDTHKCIRDGVPNLVKLSNEMGVKFSFFLNAGRAISFHESLKHLFTKEEQVLDKARHMSAIQKLGIKDYVLAALVNPKLSKYKNNIQELLNSECEVGLHGGINHELWACHANEYTSIQIKEELIKAIESIKKIDSRFNPVGFASPNWNSPECLPYILKQLGFKYYRDNHGTDIDEISFDDEIPKLYVNLLGESGGVAFFEYERSCNKSTGEIIEDVKESLEKHTITVLYDHPYFAGINEIETLREIIDIAIKNNVKIVTFEELL